MMGAHYDVPLNLLNNVRFQLQQRFGVLQTFISRKT